MKNSPGSSTAALDPPQPAKKPSSRPLRVLKISGCIALLMAAALAALPYILTTKSFHRSLTRKLSETLGTDVEIASYSIGWFSGLSLEGLVVHNPPDYAQAFGRPEMLRLGRVDFDLGFANLLRFKLDLEASLTGLDLHVLQKADGHSNLERLFGRLRVDRIEVDLDRHRAGWKEADDADMGLERMRLDLELRDCRVEIAHLEHGVLEEVEDINLRLHKAFGSSSLKLECSADIHRPDKPNRPGRIQLLGRIGPAATDGFEVELHCLGLDLERYQAILAALLPAEMITRFAGQVRADCKLRCDPDQYLEFEGLLEIEKPRFAGELFAGMNLEAERWSLRPNVKALLGEDWALEDADVSGFELDLGFLQVRGLSSKGPGAEFGFRLDLEDLGELGEPFLGNLAESGGRVEGRLRLDPELWRDARAGLQASTADAEIRIDQLELDGHSIRDGRGDLHLADAQLAIQLDVAQVNGGPMHIEATAWPFTRGEIPIHLAMDLKGSEARADDIRPLSYLVPFMAGSKPPGMVSFKSLVNFEVELDGPYDPTRHGSLVASLAALKGRGKLSMRGGNLIPADEISRLFSVLGRREVLEVSDLASEFTLQQGRIETSMLELGSRGRRFLMRGTTSLKGEIDFLIDANDLLRGHRDGERIRKYLGSEGLQARLTGNLDAPSLAMPDLADLMRKAAGKTIDQELEKQARKGVDRLIRKIFKKKKD